MQVNPTATGHHATKTCKAMYAARLQQKAVPDTAVAMHAKCYGYGEALERVEVFKYLGRLIAFDDDDTQAVRGNLAKVCRDLRADLTRFTNREHAYPRMRHVPQRHCAVCSPFWEQNIGFSTRHP